jgi:hypothetical protein
VINGMTSASRQWTATATHPSTRVQRGHRGCNLQDRWRHVRRHISCTGPRRNRRVQRAKVVGGRDAPLQHATDTRDAVRTDTEYAERRSTTHMRRTRFVMQRLHVPQAPEHGVHGEQRAVSRRVPHGVSHGAVEHYDGRQRPEAGARDCNSGATNSGHPLRTRHTRNHGGSEG